MAADHNRSKLSNYFKKKKVLMTKLLNKFNAFKVISSIKKQEHLKLDKNLWDELINDLRSLQQVLG